MENTEKNCMEPDLSAMHEKIKKIRCDCMMTQQEFGSVLGISREQVDSIETGKERASLLLQLSICELFSVNGLWFFQGAESYLDYIEA